MKIQKAVEQLLSKGEKLDSSSSGASTNLEMVIVLIFFYLFLACPQDSRAASLGLGGIIFISATFDPHVLHNI